LRLKRQREATMGSNAERRPPLAKLTIRIDSAGKPDPAALGCKAGDQITWTNGYSASLTTFHLPSCVSPQTSPAPVAAGASTRSYTVNSGVKGSFDYSYGWPTPKRDTRGGTIDIS
jgi:plastocyanin